MGKVLGAGCWMLGAACVVLAGVVLAGAELTASVRTAPSESSTAAAYSAPSREHPAPSRGHPAPSTEHPALGAKHPALNAQHPASVVIELFTSEGCSSCPPADELLSRFAKDPVLGGVPIIPLGMHVTYWDQLGWKDPSSLPIATERQQAYGRVFGPDRVYTPQAVIDGKTEVIGSAEAGIRRAVADAAGQVHASLTLSASVTGSRVTADVSMADVPAAPRDPLQTVLVVTEDGLTSIVKRGENGGRTLHNDAVVRLLFGGDAGAAASHSYRADLGPEWHRDRLHVTALLQGKSTRRIYGAVTAVPEIRH